MGRRYHKLKNEAMHKIVEFVCDGYIDSLLTSIKEYEEYFPYTIACVNFINELNKKNQK